MDDRPLDLDLPEDIESLLAAERAIPEAPAAAKQAVYEGVARQAALWKAAPGPESVGAAVSGAAASGITIGRAALAGLSVGLFSLGVAVGVLVTRQSASPPIELQPAATRLQSDANPEVRTTIQKTTPPPAASATPTSRGRDDATQNTPRVVAPTVTPAKKTARKRRIKATGKTDHTKSRRSTLAAERELLDVARAAVSRHNGKDALAAIKRHARRFAKGALLQERESLRIQALVLVGRVDEARKHLDRFIKRFPNSLLRGAAQRAVRRAER
jgi:hypothetical protein